MGAALFMSEKAKPILFCGTRSESVVIIRPLLPRAKPVMLRAMKKSVIPGARLASSAASAITP